ncbi:terpene synthase family protein [Polyangium jinanense]|uniref:Terpene synthase n=1 Tax=Polyangium jinanense TaxID=2829994 RepID=A0A9X4AS53_9BACT|nr:hypothetical protein [Polyangium jinanense]MDC3954539.1 hypothetical protein [Polyangium jinanense]MDC3980842.1 hypothetical protein [Polyangium jinanense]
MNLMGSALYCPLPSALHPNGAEAQAATLRWARSHDLLATETGYARLEKIQLGTLAARFFPHIDAKALQIATDWLAVFFLTDDLSERAEVHPIDTATLLGRQVGVLRGTEPPRSDVPMAHAFEDLRLRMTNTFSEAWFARFVDKVADLFAGFAWEAINRRNRFVPHGDLYLEARKTTIGLYPLIELADADRARPAGTAARKRPEVSQLESLACLLVGMANDLFTYARELEEGDYHNLVLVLMREKRIGAAQAEELVIGMHNERMRQWFQLSERLRQDDPDESTRRFVTALGHLLRGHLDWAYDNGRYQVSPTLPPRVAVQQPVE